MNIMWQGVRNQRVRNQRGDFSLRMRLLEWCVNLALALATANIVLIYIMGGYALNIGPLQVRAYHLKNPLILFSIAIALKIACARMVFRGSAGVDQIRELTADGKWVPAPTRMSVRDGVFVLVIFILSRGLIFAALTISPWFVAQSANPHIWHIDDSPLRPLLRWDAGWYLNIAVHGYSYDGDPTHEQNIVFLPLYPLLCQLCSEVVGLSIPQCAILLSNLAWLLGLWALYCLVRRELSAQVARHTLALLAFFPASLFFSTMYTESFYFCFSVLAFAAFRQQRFLQGGLWSGLATATRVPGILLCVPLLYEGLFKRKIHVPYWRVFGALCLTAAGLLAYMLYLWVVFGDPIANFRVQQQAPAWQRTFAWPFESLASGLRQSSSATFTPFPFDAWLTLLFIGLACLTPLYLPSSYALYSLLGIAMPLFTSAGIVSMTRYLVVLFPPFMMLGLIGSHWGWVSWLIGAVFTVALVYFSMHFAQWHWVG